MVFFSYISLLQIRLCPNCHRFVILCKCWDTPNENTRIRLPAKLPCHKYNLRQVSCTILLSNFLCLLKRKQLSTTTFLLYRIGLPAKLPYCHKYNLRLVTCNFCFISIIICIEAAILNLVFNASGSLTVSESTQLISSTTH